MIVFSLKISLIITNRLLSVTIHRQLIWLNISESLFFFTFWILLVAVFIFMLPLERLVEVIAQGLHGLFSSPQSRLVGSLGHRGHEGMCMLADEPDSTGDGVPEFSYIVLGGSHLVEGVGAKRILIRVPSRQHDIAHFDFVVMEELLHFLGDILFDLLWAHLVDLITALTC